MDEKEYEALILGRRENFSWVTTGGDATVVNSTQNSISCLVFTREKHYFISHMMDGERILAEQMPSQGYELVELFWYEGEPFIKALQIAGKNVAADIPLPGIKNTFSEVLDLHYPMTGLEFDRLRWLGSSLNSIFIEMGKIIRTDMDEIEIAAHFQYLQSVQGIASDALITGGDERIFKYRHPMPSNNKVKKYVMLHSAARKWGLHAPVTRLYSIGNPGDGFLKPFKAVASIQAMVFKNIKPSMAYSQILEVIKCGYSETGYENEWKNHFQGGPTGYVIVDGTRCLTDKQIQINTPFEWFFTVPGSKTAELALLDKNGLQIASNDKRWPQFTIETKEKLVQMPGIYII